VYDVDRAVRLYVERLGFEIDFGGEEDPDSIGGREYSDESTQARDTSLGTREFGFRDPDGSGLIYYRDL
jgi:hypothetical protein